VNREANEFRGEQVTFRVLFDRHPVVEIPIIQRDYAQGRKSATEVRTEFLSALCKTLEKNDEETTLPLDLDFVYGSVEGSGRKAFLLLDGQQRLTTLFLLHWYLAWKDGKWDHFTAFIKFKDVQKSRFSYAVRSSSEEFFDFLVTYYPGAAPSGGLKLSDMISDQSRFFRSWKLDPTIQSALEMLDAIDRRFANKNGFYDRLVRSDRPYITFHLLNLKHFGLSDELYIKMNARGKALTAFETFKARLEQKLNALFPVETMTLHEKQVSIKAYFSDRIDTSWADLFWNYRDPKTDLFDEKTMNLIRVLAIVTREPDHDGTDAALKELIDETLSFSFAKYEENRCIDRKLVETLIFVLDIWCGVPRGIKTHLRDAAYYDENSMFESVIKDATKVTYAKMVQFHAYCAYVRKNRDDMQLDSFWDWMRVIKNLAENSTYGGLDAFCRSIRSVNDLLGASQRILHQLSDPKVKVQGFNEQQIREERLKAQLILRGDEWRLLILESEQHGYFKGQIEFLFTFSGVLKRWLESETCTWSETDNAMYLNLFREYFAKASAVFSAKGLNDFGKSRWERALLSIGDYLLRKGSNYSFLIDSERDVSWKTLLQGGIEADDFVEVRRRYVKDLFDQIDLKASVNESLDSVIGRVLPMPEWRRLIVQSREMIEFCQNRMIRWQSENCVYLLRGIRMSGAHAELFTYNLYVGLLLEKHKKGDLVPFAKPDYYEPHTDSEEPCAYLNYKCAHGIIALDVANKNGDFELKLFNREGVLPAKLKDAMQRKARFAEKDGETISRTVDRLNVEETIDEVVNAVREFANTPIS
jgi:hypothetical protein